MAQVAGWDDAAEALWLNGQRAEAIRAVLALVNAAPSPKPPMLVLQLVYYAFLSGDERGAAGLCEHGLADNPGHQELLRNAAMLNSRIGNHARAIEHAEAYAARWPDDYNIHDTLCSAHAGLGNRDAAAEAGTRALELKDRQVAGLVQGWALPAVPLSDYLAARGGRDVIAFSLFGANPRYLRGAIDNALAAPQVYPGWQVRFHVDGSVPAEVRGTLRELGCEVIREGDGQPLRRKLCWRFKAANDPEVGRFLVRDVDSLVSEREALAVAEWCQSGQWFHAMRDWWTHTDLLLAGMWGGVSGVLPDLGALLHGWKSPTAETPNVDQIFLRDRVWPMVRQSCLIHDRCFSALAARLWPWPPPESSMHVGQNEIAVRREAQEARLGPWLGKLPSLALPQ